MCQLKSRWESFIHFSGSEKNGFIIFLARWRWKHPWEKIHDEINSFRPIRYIADMSESKTRRKEENIRRDVRLATVLGAKPPSFRGDAPNGSYRTLLHHPHRPCVRLESCVHHSLRVKSTDARHPVFFHFRLLRATRCISGRTRSFPLS